MVELEYRDGQGEAPGTGRVSKASATVVRRPPDRVISFGGLPCHGMTGVERLRLSTRIVEYLGGLTLAGGDHDGEPFVVLPWECRFVCGAFRGPGDSALSVARGNGKSALVCWDSGGDGGSFRSADGSPDGSDLCCGVVRSIT